MDMMKQQVNMVTVRKGTVIISLNGINIRVHLRHLILPQTGNAIIVYNMIIIVHVIMMKIRLEIKVLS